MVANTARQGPTILGPTGRPADGTNHKGRDPQALQLRTRTSRQRGPLRAGSRPSAALLLMKASAKSGLQSWIDASSTPSSRCREGTGRGHSVDAAILTGIEWCHRAPAGRLVHNPHFGAGAASALPGALPCQHLGGAQPSGGGVCPRHALRSENPGQMDRARRAAGQRASLLQVQPVLPRHSRQVSQITTASSTESASSAGEWVCVQRCICMAMKPAKTTIPSG